MVDGDEPLWPLNILSKPTLCRKHWAMALDFVNQIAI